MARLNGLLAMARVQAKQHRRITADDLLAFFQQLSTLLSAGTPLLSALRLASEQSESKKLSKVIKDISNKVAAGETFHTATQHYPTIFKIHWIQIIRTGEISGKLAMVIKQLYTDFLRSQETQGKIISALIYPIILMIVAIFSVFIMLWKVVPTFADFLQGFGSKLPPITQTVISISNFIQHRAILIIVSVVLGTYAFKQYLKTENGNRLIRSILMALPVIGEVYVQSAMEKFSANLSLLLKSGTPLLESIRTIQEVFGADPIYYATLGNVYNSVARGNDLTTALGSSGLFTAMMLNIARIGEESGRLSEVMEQIADYYRHRVETLVDRLTRLLEPLIVIAMGGTVAGLLASIYIPMFQMAAGGQH